MAVRRSGTHLEATVFGSETAVRRQVPQKVW